jgi:hypothetical protein
MQEIADTAPLFLNAPERITPQKTRPFHNCFSADSGDRFPKNGNIVAQIVI